MQCILLRLTFFTEEKANNETEVNIIMRVDDNVTNSLLCL